MVAFLILHPSVVLQLQKRQTDRKKQFVLIWKSGGFYCTLAEVKEVAFPTGEGCTFSFEEKRTDPETPEISEILLCCLSRS